MKYLSTIAISFALLMGTQSAQADGNLVEKSAQNNAPKVVNSKDNMDCYGTISTPTATFWVDKPLQKTISRIVKGDTVHIMKVFDFDKGRFLYVIYTDKKGNDWHRLVRLDAIEMSDPACPAI